MVALLAALACSCKKKDSLAPVELGEDPAEIDAQAAAFAPGLPRPRVAVLDSGLLLHWLTEPETTAFHVRLAMPLPAKVDAAATAVAIEALALAIDKQTAKLRTNAVVHRAPGRIELAIHGDVEDAEAILDALTEAVSERKPSATTKSAIGRAYKLSSGMDAPARAAATAVDVLFDRPSGHEAIDRDAITEVTKARMDKAWAAIVDPRTSVLCVHGGVEPEALTAPLERLSSRFRSRTPAPLTRAGASESAIARIHAGLPVPRDVAGKGGRGLVGNEPKATLLRAEASGGRSTVLLARLLDLSRREDRALARLAQRLLQEEADARLVIAGGVGLFAIRLPILRQKVAEGAQSTLTTITQLSRTPQPRERLIQAARLWLGARLVEASLEGEDWTRLWSESVDLAGSDGEIATALAYEATAMLTADPQALSSWMQANVDPSRGDPAWIAVAAALSDDELQQLVSLGVSLRP